MTIYPNKNFDCVQTVIPDDPFEDADFEEPVFVNELDDVDLGEIPNEVVLNFMIFGEPDYDDWDYDHEEFMDENDYEGLFEENEPVDILHQMWD